MKYGFTSAPRLTNVSRSLTCFYSTRISVHKRRISSYSHHIDSAPVTPVTPLQLPSGSLLPLVRSCSNLILPHNPWQSETPHIIASHNSEGAILDEEIVVPFLISHHSSERPVGYLRQQVASALEDDHQRHLVSGSASPWDLRYSKDSTKCLKTLAFADWVNEGGKFTRTMHVERIVLEWQKRKMFKELLKNWSDQLYPVYNHPPLQPTSADDPIAFAVERAAVPLFGLVNFGCLMTAYVYDPESEKTMLWIPRRSMMKRNWPGKLDVTVGGGMGLGYTAMSIIIQESAEEALLDSDYVQKNICPVGVLPFLNRSPRGWALPGMYYLFDLPLPPDGSVTPRINALDGEVQGFELLDIDTIFRSLLEGQFKPSSTLAILDFLLRHGFYTHETDPRYLDVCRLLKANIDLPVAWGTYH
ncbi:hypothetical protein BYT27DRAFT_7198959 [Phlegmacium glaucopus]|nr:hypothetical protein BYT27DRAFT_7198959 [Phlegmacium glaucopus]